MISRASALPLESVRTRQYKYIHSLDTDAPNAYYDLESDSDERENLVAERREAVAAADAVRISQGARCVEWLERHPVRDRGEHYIENKPGWIINRDEIDEKLRSLGYLEQEE